MTILSSLRNIEFNSIDFSKTPQNQLFLCAIGYEQRSTFLLSILKKFLPPENIFCIFFDDYEKHKHSLQAFEEFKSTGVNIHIIKYSEYDKVINLLAKIVEQTQKNKEPFSLHIDYSSMPRVWYCRIPNYMYNHLQSTNYAHFWYSEGHYLTDSERFPSAGVNNFTVFSGKPSLSANNHRSHIFGLGFDHIRSQAILSVIDPSFLIVCYSFPPADKSVEEKILTANKDIFSSSVFSFSLPINDFCRTISKINDITRDLHCKGDVVLLPDGPKPLILAMSLIPPIIGKEGIVCLHITRNKDFVPLDVEATGKISGFAIAGV